jgi:hypothetical protein
MLDWRTVVIHQGQREAVQFANCPLCAALLPDWDAAKLCHERWHTTLRLIDGTPSDG